MITPGTSSESTPADETGRRPSNDDAVERLRERVLQAADEIRRLRAENAQLKQRLEEAPETAVDIAASLGLPEDPDERRAALDELIRTVDFYIRRDS